MVPQGPALRTQLARVHGPCSPLSSSVWSQDGSCPPPEEPSRDQPDDKKDTPWGAHFQLPPMLLETDR